MAKNETLYIRVYGDIKQSAEKTPSAPESVVAHSKDEIYEMLEVGRKQIQAGKVIDADAVMTRIRDEHGFSN